MDSKDLGVKLKGEDARGSGRPISASERSEALRILVEQHNSSLVRLMALKLGSETEAKDVVQEAYGRILMLEDSKVVSHLRAYLFRTANNIAIDRLRERARRPEVADFDFDEMNSDLESSESQVEQSVDAEQKLELIRAIIAELPPKCRMAFLLFRVEGHSYNQVANQLGVSESMIRKYVLRAVRHCYTRLKDYA